MSRKQGQQLEQIAASYLQKHRLRLVMQNFNSYRGEIDLVMLDQQQLVFVEVRYRRSVSHGSAAETVTLAKQRKLVLAAEFFLQRYRQHANRPCRFDVVAINGLQPLKIDWIKDAFIIR